MLRFITSILLLLLLAFSSCNKPADLTEDEIYSLLNEVIVDDSLFLGSVFSKFDDDYLLYNGETYFSENDLEFAYKQKERFSKLTIAPNKLKKYNAGKFRSGVSPWLEISNDTTNGVAKQFSFPLISIDRKTMLISMNTLGNCFLSGSGGTYIYQKINGHWKRVESYGEWVSMNSAGTRVKDRTDILLRNVV